METCGKYFEPSLTRKSIEKGEKSHDRWFVNRHIDKIWGRPQNNFKVDHIDQIWGRTWHKWKVHRKNNIENDTHTKIRQSERHSAFYWSKIAWKHKYLVYIYIYMEQVLFEKLQLYCTAAVSLDNTNCWKCSSPVVSEESKTYVQKCLKNIQHQKAQLEASAFYHLFFFI